MLNFADWKRQVDNHLADRVGLTSDDLPDLDYYDLFSRYKSPRQAARFALRRAMLTM